MKKVTLIFVVDENIANEIQNEMAWGEMANAAAILNENCEESDYDIEDYSLDENNKLETMACYYHSLTDADKDKFLKMIDCN